MGNLLPAPKLSRAVGGTVMLYSSARTESPRIVEEAELNIRADHRHIKQPGELKKLKRGFNFEQTWIFLVQKMKTIVAVNLALISVLVVAGSKFEAIDGQNVTISFDIDEVEKADEVRITFKEDKKKYSVLIAQKPWLYDDPQDPGVTLILGKGRVSVIIQNISISRSGLYKAEAYTREKVSEETATLVVNKAPVSSSPSPPHSSSSPKPPRSSDLHWTVIVIVIVIVIALVIVVSGSVCFWKLRRKRKRAADEDEEEEEEETPAVSSVSKKKWKNNCSDCVSVV